jgi:hypothetical protein
MSGLEEAKKIDLSGSFKRAASKTNKTKQAAPFSLRLTFEERARLERMAKGMSLGAYIRQQLLGDNARKRTSRQRRPTIDRVALAKALSTLGNSRLASNMNQIAKAAHRGTLGVGPELSADLMAACADIQLMRDELMRALRAGTEGPE